MVGPSRAREILSSIGWLSLQPEEFQEEVYSRAVPVKYRAGEVIYRLGDPLGGIYGFVSGAVVVSVAPPNALPSQITRAQRDAIGTPYPYIVLPPDFAHSDSFITHDLRVTRIINLGERVKLNLIGEGFNIFNIANLTGYSGTLNAYIRPTSAAVPGRDPSFTFGQPTGRVSPIFGTGGARAFQLAARVSF